MGEGFPLWSLAPMAWERESPSEIGSISLSPSGSAFPDPSPSLFLLYPEIRNSDWGESFAQIYLIKLSFLRQKKSVNRLTGGPGKCQARQGGGGTRLPYLLAISGTFCVDSSSGKSQIFQNNSPSVFISFGFRLILGFCKT